MINHHFSGVSPCHDKWRGCGDVREKGKILMLLLLLLLVLFCTVTYMDIYNNRCDLMNDNWSCCVYVCASVGAIAIYRLYYVHEYQHIYVCGTAHKYSCLCPETGTKVESCSWSLRLCCSWNGNGSGQAVKVSWNHKRKSRNACDPLEASGVGAMIFHFTPESHALIFSSLGWRPHSLHLPFLSIHCHLPHLPPRTLNWH